ncbi:MAG: hypothetical protein JWN24_1463 [Phycisphaerales bacterium]|nr:hypothetical protein [Phycisphaerales bacterium]
MANHHRKLQSPANETGPVDPGSTMHRLLEMAAEQVAAELAAGSPAETKSGGHLDARPTGGQPARPQKG